MAKKKQPGAPVVAPQASGDVKGKDFVREGETGDSFLEGSLNLTMDSLSDEDKEKLSKVLFPETHTDTISILGVDRTLHPTSLKVSRIIYALTKEVQEKVQQQTDEDDAKVFTSMAEFEDDFESVVIGTLTKVAKCLCDFYGSEWDDIKVALADEDLSLAELQAISYTQQELNTSNDFFLQPLRAFVRVLQAREVATLIMEKYVTTSTTLP